MHFATGGAAVMLLTRPKTTTETRPPATFTILRALPITASTFICSSGCACCGTSTTPMKWISTRPTAAWPGRVKHVGRKLEQLRPPRESTRDACTFVRWRRRSVARADPFVSQSNCFVVPPMKFAKEALECLRVAVEGGMPVLLLSAGQAGATTPATLAGAVSQAWAECIRGPRLCERDTTGRTGDYRRLAICLRPAYRRP